VSTLPIFVKDPDATKDYHINWSTWLGSSDEISSSTWTVPTGLTEVRSTNSTTLATIWLSGGTAGEDYELVNRIVSTDGRTEDQTFVICVRAQ